MRYSIILPCYNEAGNLEPLVKRFQPYNGRYSFELILVDNGSTDNTRDILERLLADPANKFIRVVTIEVNKGYGHGIHAGLLAATGDIVAYSHADAQTPPEDVFRAFDLMESGEVDPSRVIIKGRRPGREESNLCTHGLTVITNLMTGYKFDDINGQPKVFQRDLLEHMSDPVIDFSYDAYVLYMAARKGMDIVSLDVRFDPRGHGVSKSAASAFRRYKTIASYLRSMTRMIWRRRAEKSNVFGQIVRFLVSGVCTNITNYIFFYALLTFLGVNYVLASLVGFFSGFVLGFVMNRTWTFGASGGRVGSELFLFLLVNLLSLGVNVAVIWFAVDVLGIIPEIGQLLAISASAVVNFLGMKKWVFNKRGHAS